MNRRTLIRILLLASLTLILPASAFAHREDYADETLVFLTLHQNELEPEYWLDIGHNDATHYARHSLAVEYGITEHWMIDSRASWLQPEHSPTSFDSGRLETRYRFYEEGTLPVDVAVSAELNNEQSEEGRRWGIEPRLILSKDFEKANITVNFAEEVGLSSHETSFDPSLAMRYDATRVVRFGTELRYFTGEDGGAIIPQMAINLPHDVTLRFAFSWGIGNAHESNFTRMSVEAGLGDEDE